MTEKQTKTYISCLKNGGVGVLGTDTLYGLVGSALLPRTVERIYELKQRDPCKPLIILISSLADLKLFKIKGTIKDWPEKTSIIFACKHQEFTYLHKGTNSLAFRLPQKPSLVSLLERTGPLVAPSANPEGSNPAETIEQARQYFGDNVDFYLDEGRLSSFSSTLIAFDEGKVIIKRKGTK